MRILALLALILLLNSCDGGNKAAAPVPGQQETPRQPPASKMTQEGTEKLVAVLTRYYILKDALVASNEQEAGKAAQDLVAAADSFRHYVLTPSAAMADLGPELDTIISSAGLIAAAKDSVIDRQRQAFEPVSDNMFRLLHKAELRNAGVYQQHCPMAFNNKGANWLSNTDEIRNPYFGKRMLECGEVTDSLK